jgi:hypothetical protein
LLKYLGNGVYAKKYSRVEKAERKERVGFTLGANPLLAIFSRVNEAIEGEMKRVGFQVLKG